MSTKERQQYQQSLVDLIGSRPVAYYPALAKKVGGVKAAVMLSQLLYWNGDASVQKRDGWFYKSVEDMENETGLTKTEQQTAREELQNRGIIELKLKGIPRIWHYKVNISALGDILIEQESHPMGKSSNEKPADIGKESAPILEGNPAQLNKESETTTETTTETTSSGEDQPEEKELPDEDMSIEATPGGRVLHGLLARENKAKKRRTIKEFPTLVLRDTWRADCENRLTTKEIENAVLAALKANITTLPRIVAYVAKWNVNGNGKKAPAGNGRAQAPTTVTPAPAKQDKGSGVYV